MNIKFTVFSSLFLFGVGANASPLNENPFLMPSERIIITEEEDSAEVNQCSDEFIQKMAEELAKEIEIQQPPEFDPKVLGKWTRQQVEESEYIGETNGVKIYYHNQLKQYIYLDLTKAK